MSAPVRYVARGFAMCTWDLVMGLCHVILVSHHVLGFGCSQGITSINWCPCICHNFCGCFLALFIVQVRASRARLWGLGCQIWWALREPRRAELTL